MGGGHSVENIADNITTSISDLVVRTNQSVYNKSSQTQFIDINCDDFNNAAFEFQTKCFTLFKDKSVDDILRLCSVPSCNGKNINMNSTMAVNLTVDQKNEVKSKISSNLEGTIQQAGKQATGIFTFGNTVKNVIKNEMNSIIEVVNDAAQNALNSTNQSQTITVSGGSVNYISMELGANIVSKSLQDNYISSEAVNRIAMAIKQDADQQSSSGPIKILIYIIIGIVTFLIVLGFILWIIKRNRRISAKDKSIKT